MYIHVCWATSDVKMENLSNSRDLTLGLPAYITRAGSGRLLPYTDSGPKYTDRIGTTEAKYTICNSTVH
jgi:hypothetical protein